MTESNALDSAIAAGVALLVIQGRVGSMKDWTAKNLREIGSSTLKLYMQLARGRDKIEAARKDAPFLSIREARQLLTTKRRSKQEPEQEEDPELTDVQLIRQLTASGLDWLLKNLPEDWRIEFLNRLRGPVLRAAQREHPNTRLKNLNLRLVHSSDRPTKH